MTFVHSTNVYVWKERLFGKPVFKPSRLSLYDNGRILWEREESGKQKGSANLRDVFEHVRIGVLDSEVKRERASDDGLILAYHTLILPLELAQAGGMTTGPPQEREFALAFEREVFDWMQAFARVSNTTDRFADVIRKYRFRKKYNAYSGSSHYGLAGLSHGPDLPAITNGSNGSNGSNGIHGDETNAGDGGDDPARLWSAAHGASEDYVQVWTAYREQAIGDLAAMGGWKSTSTNGYSCVKCWQAN